MLVEPEVVLGLLILAAELLALATVGFVVARVVLCQSEIRLAMAQGLVLGPALWGLTVNFVAHLLPGRAAALAAWMILLSAGIVLARRSPQSLRIQPRLLLAFAIASIAVFWIALACRQLLGIPDELLHSMIPATIQAGGWPPSLAWNPGVNLAYHHGIDLLVALLAPPIGPDQAFTTEMLGAYAWTSLILIIAAALLRSGSRLSALTLLPLLLATGAWTLVFGDQPTLLQIPVPSGVPLAGIRAALSDLYWPSAELPWASEQQGVPPNISKPAFSFAYALAFAVLERIVAAARRPWAATLTLAALVGFLGLLDETVAPIVLGLWIVVAAAEALRARPTQSQIPAALLRTAAGPLLAVALLLASGGVFTGILTGSSGSGELDVRMATGSTRVRGALSLRDPVERGAGIAQPRVAGRSRNRDPARPPKPAGPSPCRRHCSVRARCTRTSIRRRPTRHRPLRRTRPKLRTPGTHAGAQ